MKEFRKLVNIWGSYGQEFSVLICFDSRWCRKTPGWPVCVAATKHRVSSQAENCLASVDSRQRPRLLPSIGKYLRRISPSPSTKAQQTYFTVNCWGVPPPVAHPSPYQFGYTTHVVVYSGRPAVSVPWQSQNWGARSDDEKSDLLWSAMRFFSNFLKQKRSKTHHEAEYICDF